jgi:chromatin segregation and condensation protein Rec8/ScpA/Scc1 (kleisin family)
VLAAAPATDLSHTVESEEVTVRDCMVFVMSLFDEKETVEFRQIFGRDGGAAPGRPLVIATFLAVLELARLSALRLFQSLNAAGVPEGEIRLRAVRDSDASSNWADRITDTM